MGCFYFVKCDIISLQTKGDIMKKTLLPLLSLMVVLGGCDKQPEYIAYQDAFCGHRQADFTCKDKMDFCEKRVDMFFCEDADGNPLTGHVTNFYLNGNKQFEVAVKNGLATGVFKSFYRDGKINEQAMFKDGVLDGVVKEYDKDGILQGMSYYKNGQEQGKNYLYHKNGNVSMVSEVVNGKQYSTLFYENGAKKQQNIYGTNTSVFKDYDENGNLVRIIYKNYDTKVIGEENYLNGKLNGIRKKYKIDDDGKDVMLLEETWQNGKLNGTKKVYNSNGGILSETNYKDDMRHGVSKDYWANGVLASEVSFFYDELHGALKRFYINGQLRTEENYYHDENTGVSRNYDDQGHLISETIYEDGEPITELVYQDGVLVETKKLK